MCEIFKSVKFLPKHFVVQSLILIKCKPCTINLTIMKCLLNINGLTAKLIFMQQFLVLYNSFLDIYKIQLYTL